MDIDKAAREVSGRCISRLTAPKDGHLAIYFVDGSALRIQRQGQGLAVELRSDKRSAKCPAAAEPTPRQREYLEFIKKLRFGISPAESDIQRHFLVSAPTVNQMTQALERLGFITRQSGVPRSIGLVDVTSCDACGRSHYLKKTRISRDNSGTTA